MVWRCSFSFSIKRGGYPPHSKLIHTAPNRNGVLNDANDRNDLDDRNDMNEKKEVSTGNGSVRVSWDREARLGHNARSVCERCDRMTALTRSLPLPILTSDRWPACPSCWLDTLY